MDGNDRVREYQPGEPPRILAGKPSLDTLRDSEERYRRLTEDSPSLICTFLPDSTLTYVNAAYAEYFRREPDDLLGRRFVEFLPDDGTRERAIEQFLSLTPAEPLITYEHPVIGPDRSERWQRWTDRAFFDEHGRHAYFQSVGDDITESKRSEEQVSLLSAAVEAAADATVITDERGVIQWINPAFTVLTGYTAEEALGRNHGELLRSGCHDEAFYADLWETILAGQTWRGELINRRKDGRLYTEEQTITPVRDAGGRIHHFIGIKHDITDRKEAEAELKELRDRLHETRRMESIGRLAGKVAHDVNNLLLPIRGYADLILRKCAPSGPQKAYLKEIADAVDRAADLTGKILAFGRGQVLRPETLSLNGIIRDFAPGLRSLLGDGIELNLDLDPDLKPLRGDRTLLEQVIVNLAMNAREAMPGGGVLSLKTATELIDEGHAFTVGREVVLPGRYVVLEVADTGHGMEAETRQRAFEPFFTTRSPGENRGLGLAIVYGIVGQHNGYVWARSRPNHGTAVEVYLKAAEEEMPDGAGPPRGAGAPAGGDPPNGPARF